MEISLIHNPLLKLLPCMQRHHISHRHILPVHVIDTDRRRGRALPLARTRPLEVPDCWRARVPCCTQHTLGVTVDVAEVWGGGVGAEEDGGFVEDFGGVGALAAASAVAASDEDHVFVGGGGFGFGGRGEVGGEEGFIVGHCEGGGGFGSQLGGRGADGVVGGFGDRGGNVGFCFGEPGLGLFHERVLGLGGGEGGEGEGEEGVEMHGWCICSRCWGDVKGVYLLEG